MLKAEMSCADVDTRLGIRYILFLASRHALSDQCACSEGWSEDRRRALVRRRGVSESMAVAEYMVSRQQEETL